MSIPAQVQICLDSFPNELDETEKAILDELGRFRIWCNNVSAEYPAHKRISLEYRLRDASSLRTTALSLLRDLKKALDQFRECCSRQSSLPPEPDPVTTLPGEHDDTPCHSGKSPASEDMFELSDESDTEDIAPAQRSLNRIHEIITCLFRFSTALRDPGRADSRRHASEVNCFVQHAIDHVRSKFPAAPDFLVERLGRSFAAHRQYLRYREIHHELPQQEAKKDQCGHPEQRNTLATSLPARDSAVESQSRQYGTSNYMPTSHPGTVGSDLLAMPSWSSGAFSGEPFKCPICNGIVKAPWIQAWFQHVFEDIPPYMCTHSTCTIAARPFSRRRDWAHHEKHAHRTTWSCPSGCDETLQNVDQLQMHLQSSHSKECKLLELQQTSLSINMEDPSSVEPLSCPLCSKSGSFDNFKDWTNHVGHHFEELALSALPHSLFEDDASTREVQSMFDEAKKVITSEKSASFFGKIYVHIQTSPFVSGLTSVWVSPCVSRWMKSVGTMPNENSRPMSFVVKQKIVITRVKMRTRL